RAGWLYHGHHRGGWLYHGHHRVGWLYHGHHRVGWLYHGHHRVGWLHDAVDRARRAVHDGHDRHVRRAQPIGGPGQVGGEVGSAAHDQRRRERGDVVTGRVQVVGCRRLEPGMRRLLAAHQDGRRVRFRARRRQDQDAEPSFRVTADGLEVHLAD